MIVDFDTVVDDGFVRHPHHNRLRRNDPTISAYVARCLQVEDDDHRVRHLALLSQYAVFKDILPSYRIRVPTAAEMTTKVSKDVHRVRAQEAALLRAYQVRLAFVWGASNQHRRGSTASCMFRSRAFNARGKNTWYTLTNGIYTSK